MKGFNLPTRIPAESEPVSRELKAAAAKVRRRQEALDAARVELREEILKAAKGGLSVRAIALQTGLTYGRVGQILKGRR